MLVPSHQTLPAPERPDVSASRRPVSAGDYVRLSTLFCRSRDVAPYQGPLVRTVAPLLALVSFGYNTIRGWRPDIVALECDGRLIGGVLVSRFGSLATLVIDQSHPQRRVAYERLSTAIDTVFQGRPDLRFEYWTLKSSIVRAGTIRGFRQTGRRRYLVTAPLGPLRFSWIRSQPHACTRLLTCEPLCHLVRE